MIVRFVEEAQREFFDAILYYEAACDGLGRRFKDEVNRCVLAVTEHPELYRFRTIHHQRINLRIFPFYLPFIVREETLWILAVAHGSRKPLYWISRRNKI